MQKIKWKNPTKSECLFLVYYSMFVISLFIDDLALESGANNIAQFLKAGVLIILCVCMLQKKMRKYEVVSFAMLFGFGMVVLLFTGDFFWIIVLVMGECSSEIDEKYIFKVSACVVMVVLLLGFLGFCIGILPDVLSYRTDFSIESRHSLGFSHSTVLPLGIFYLISYYVSMKENRARGGVLIILSLFSVVLYFFCDSRNALIGSMLLVFSYLLVRNLKVNTVLGKVISTFSEFVFIIVAAFSIVPMILRSKGILMDFWYKYDVIFTNRSLLASSALDAYGIHLLSHLKTADYVNTEVLVDSRLGTGIVLDNGYIYLLIRYGILILLLMMLIYNALYKTTRDSIVLLTVLSVVMFVNMTDNDFLSYGFLPYMLIGIKGMTQKNRMFSRKDSDLAERCCHDKRNIECI